MLNYGMVYCGVCIIIDFSCKRNLNFVWKKIWKNKTYCGGSPDSGMGLWICINVHYLYGGGGKYYNSQVQMYKGALLAWGRGILWFTGAYALFVCVCVCVCGGGGGIYYDSQVQIYECALFVWGWGYTMIHRCICIKVHHLYGGGDILWFTGAHV